MKSLAKVLAVTLLVLLAVSITPAQVRAGNVELNWDPPTTNVDGTPLTDLAGYKVYVGRISGTYSIHFDAKNVTTYTVTNLGDGTWYFAATAYDLDGNESAYSNEVSKIIKVAPAPPTGCSVQ